MSFTDWPRWVRPSSSDLRITARLRGRGILARAGQYALFCRRTCSAEHYFGIAACNPVIKNIRGAGFFRTLIFIPVMTSLVVWSIVWKYMFATDSGFINQAARMIGITGPAWLYDTRLAMPVVIVTSLLKNVGLNMVLFIAAAAGSGATL